MLNKSAQSAFDCGSEAAALNSSKKALASLTVLRSAFGTTIFIATKNLALLCASRLRYSGRQLPSLCVDPRAIRARNDSPPLFLRPPHKLRALSKTGDPRLPRLNVFGDYPRLSISPPQVLVGLLVTNKRLVSTVEHQLPAPHSVGDVRHVT